MVGYLSFLKIGPKLLKFLPGGWRVGCEALLRVGQLRPHGSTENLPRAAASPTQRVCLCFPQAPHPWSPTWLHVFRTSVQARRCGTCAPGSPPTPTGTRWGALACCEACGHPRAVPVGTLPSTVDSLVESPLSRCTSTPAGRPGQRGLHVPLHRQGVLWPGRRRCPGGDPGHSRSQFPLLASSPGPLGPPLLCNPSPLPSLPSSAARRGD